MFGHHAQHHAFSHHLAGLAVDVKPRLTKEQHDILESHYQQQNKPNTQTKKTFAESLGVSLDKVNNWFQNRRAKSKQDAKKAAGSTGSQADGQLNLNQPSLQLSTDDLTAQYLSPEYATPHNDSAVSVDPMMLSNGLGISQAESCGQTTATSMPATMSPDDLISPLTQKPNPLNDLMEKHRRTLTQDDFDTFAHGGDYVPNQISDKTVEESPTENNDLLSEYFPELNTYSFDDTLDNNVLGSSEMQPAFSNESYASNSSSVAEVPAGSKAVEEPVQRHPSTALSSVSDWSDHSTPSLSLTPAAQQTDSVFNPDDTEISPRGKVPGSTNVWQPGQSVPVDYQQMEREFREAALRSASHSTTSGDHTRRNSSGAFAEQPMAFPSDAAYSNGEAPGSLTQSMGNMEISASQRQRTLRHQTSLSSMSGGIAARRQRPRPQPLSSTSLRSSSYCGSLPTATGVPNSQNNLAPGGQTLRRIKSSNVMNGIASGRIQKNIGGQRSPLNFTFADAANAPKFARSVSSYSPANGIPGGNASLVPPTPLSPNEMPGGRIDFQRQLQQYHQAQAMTRQRSLGDSIDENGYMSSNTFSSPPGTPLYGPQFARNRLGMLAENTPPQSAPATQQYFSNGGLFQAPQMQPSLSQQSHMMQSQPQSYLQVMANEYPQMPNVVMPSQQPLHAGQYLDMMAAQQQQQQQQYSGMSHMMSGQGLPLNYANMQYANAMNGQQITPPQSQYQSMMSSGPGVLMSQQQAHYNQSRNMPAADFFVHEYSPPQDLKHTPRKNTDCGPKNYTFANHGPEHFEKSKSKDLTNSPGSLSGSSSSG